VSIGGHSDFGLYKHTNSLKTTFLQSVLFHAKSFDDATIVTDLDEVLVSMRPLHRGIVETIQRELRSGTCYLQNQTNSVPKITNEKATSLQERMPYRCEGGIAN